MSADRGLAAVLDYSASSTRPKLTAETHARVREPSWQRPMPRPIRQFLATIRRIRENILRVSAGDPASRRAK